MKESSDSKGSYFCFCIVEADGTSKECDVYFDTNIIYDVQYICSSLTFVSHKKCKNKFNNSQDII